MSKQIEEIKIVTALRASMLERLRSHSHKNWRNLPVNELIEMMGTSFTSLKSELFQMDLEQAKRKCADIANFSAMIFEYFGSQTQSVLPPITNVGLVILCRSCV